MDIVVDTNVVAYALLGVTEHAGAAAEALLRADALWAPDLLRSELVNVMWQWVRERGVSPSMALAVMDDADALLTHLVPANSLWAEALALSVERSHPAYDTLFVSLAAARGIPLLTYGQRVLATFPEHALGVAAWLERER